MKRGYQTKRIYSVRCKSGLIGWRTRLRNNYTGFPDFKSNSDMWGLNFRLGFESATAAWLANPIVEGSTKASDFRKVSV